MSVCSTYGGIQQRWLVVESEARKEADLKHLETKIQQHLESAQKQLKHSLKQAYPRGERSQGVIDSCISFTVQVYK